MDYPHEYKDYTEHDCETFIGWILKWMNTIPKGCKDLDFIYDFIKDYEEFGVGSYVPLTKKYPVFMHYMYSVYDDGE